jgi:hypothetical protein
MSIGDTLIWASAVPSNVPFRAIKDGLLRLYDIAFFDHGVEAQDREKAVRLIVGIKKAVEDGFASAPTELAAFKSAAEFTEHQIETKGVNSLAWLLEEQHIVATDTIPFVMKPEHGSKLKVFIGMLDAKMIQDAKPHMVRELILQRHGRAYPNTILHLHALVCHGDPAALAIFSGDEIGALIRAPYDYHSAREVLVGLGLLVAQSGALELLPPPKDDLLRFLVSQAAIDTNSEHPPEPIVRVNPPVSMEGLDGIVPIALCIHLGLTMIESLYGVDKRFVALDGIEAQFRGAAENGLMKLVGMMQNFEKVGVECLSEEVRASRPAFSIDQMMVFAAWHEFDLWPNEEPEWISVQPYLEYLLNVLSFMRIDYLIRLRNYLRFFIHGSGTVGVPPSAVAAEVRNAISELYFRYGSRAGVAEAVAFGEDWIGVSS